MRRAREGRIGCRGVAKFMVQRNIVGALRMHGWTADGAGRIHGDGQGLIIDTDLLGCITRQQRRCGNNHCHRLACMADLVAGKSVARWNHHGPPVAMGQRGSAGQGLEAS